MKQNPLRNISSRYLYFVLAICIQFLLSAQIIYADTEIAWLDANSGTIKRTQNGGIITLQTGIQDATGLAISDQSELYFLSSGRVYKISLSIGASSTPLSNNLNRLVRGLVVDSQALISSQLSIAPPTTSGWTTPATYSPSAMAIFQSPVSKLYWVDNGHLFNDFLSYDAIRRSNLNGSGSETIVSVVGGRGLAIDQVNNWIYWAENKDPTVLKRAHQDGSGVNTVLSSGLYYVTHLAFGGDRVYALDADGTVKVINPQASTFSVLANDVELGAGIVVLPDSDGDEKPDADESCPNDSSKFSAGICGCGVSDVDTDSDGVADCLDSCPTDANKTALGVCGCGVLDSDTDGDGTAQCIDQCPVDSTKSVPGACGCGMPETDTDGDGTPDCVDQCVADSAKTTPGTCGCGVPDTDTDGDGTPNCNDQCLADLGKIAPGSCGCGTLDTDTDGDGTPDCHDQCLSDAGKVAPGTCGCGVSDIDTDGDGTSDCNDQCPTDLGKITPGTCGCGVSDADTDSDGTPNCHEGCPTDAGKIASGVCGCGVADIDSDGDGVLDCQDICVNDPLKTVDGVCGCGVADVDTDGDSVPDCNDRCATDPNKSSPGKCGCGRFEIADGREIKCSNDRQVKENIEPELVSASIRNSCEVVVSFEKFAKIGGDVRYNLQVTKYNSTQKINSATALPEKYSFTVPKPGKYVIKYRAILQKNRRTIHQTKLSESLIVEISSNKCRVR